MQHRSQKREHIVLRNQFRVVNEEIHNEVGNLMKFIKNHETSMKNKVEQHKNECDMLHSRHARELANLNAYHNRKYDELRDTFYDIEYTNFPTGAIEQNLKKANNLQQQNDAMVVHLNAVWELKSKHFKEMQHLESKQAAELDHLQREFHNKYARLSDSSKTFLNNANWCFALKKRELEKACQFKNLTF